MDIRTRTGKVVIGILENLRERRKLLLMLSCIVVFITTYVLILPAFTLEKDEAAEQGGIDVPAAEQSADAVHDAGANSDESAGADSGEVSAGKQESADTGPLAPITIQNDDSKDYSVAVEGDNSVLSEGMNVNVREIDQSTGKLKKEYDELYFGALEAVQKEEGSEKPSSFAFAKFYDISLIDGKTEVEPDSAVDVKISFGEELQKELRVKDPDRVYIVHFVVDKETGEVAPKVLDTDVTDITVKNNKVTEAAFTTESFSVFAVVYTQLSTNVLAADGKTYKITVTYGDDAEIPKGATLIASEIKPGTDEYIRYFGKTWTAVNEDYFRAKDVQMKTDGDNSPLSGMSIINFSEARFFDISLIDNGKEIEPKAPVQVQISYEKGMKCETSQPIIGVAHFLENKIELIDQVKVDREPDGDIAGIIYEQNSFSGIGTYIGLKSSNSHASLKKPSMKILRATNVRTDELSPPDPVKSLVNNGNDGTYTLSLSVNGHQTQVESTEVTKSNVVIVMDRSSSMRHNVATYTEYTGAPQNGVQYYGADGSSHYEITWTYNYLTGRYSWMYPAPYVYYDNYWGRYVETTQQQPYTGKIYTKNDYNKTKLKDEQDALALLVDSLLSNNKPGETITDSHGNIIALDDVVEISVLSFADHALKGQASEVDWSTNKDTLLAGINQTNMPSGTNWEDALIYAKETADQKANQLSQQGEDTYIIFLTDGEPTAIAGETGGAHHYDKGTYKIYNDGALHVDEEKGGFEYALTGTGYNNATNDGKNALDRAKAIVDANYKFYGIFTYGDGPDQEAYLQRLVNYSYGHGDNTISSQDITNHYYSVQNSNELTEVFNNIFSKIYLTKGHAQVKITDELRQDAMTSTFVNGKPSGVTYTVTPKGSDDPLYTVKASMREGDDEPDVTFTIGGEDYTTQAGQVEKKTNPVDEANPLDSYDAGEYYSVTVDGIEYKITLASVDENGLLTWDLSPVGMLLDDCTYKADFVVWPNQDAYDYVAALNNGLTEIADSDSETDDPIPVIWNHDATTPVTDSKGNVYYQGGCEKYPSIVYYPDPEKDDDYENGIYYGTFAVLTNKDQHLDYSVVTTEDGNVTDVDPQDPIAMDLPDPMKLTAAGSRVSKSWNITRDPDALLRLLYEFDGDMPRVDENRDPIPKKYTYPVIDDETGEPVIDETGEEVTETADGFFIDFKVLQDTDNPNAPAYKTVRLGWDEKEHKYVWYGGSDYVKTKTYGEGENAVTLKYGTKWEQDFSIATGLMLTYEHLLEHNLDPADYACGTYNGKTYYLLEDGHDYKISEPELGYEFDFSAPKYHPMLVDGVMKNVLFTKNNDGSISISEIGNLEMAQDGSSLLDIINTLRGYIHVNKKVVDSNGAKVPEDDTKFTYVVTLHNDDGAFTTEGSHIPWYGISGLYYHSIDDEGEYHYYQAKAGESGRLTLTDEDGNTLNATCEGAFDEDTAGPTPVTIEGSDEPIDLYGNQMDCDEADAIEGDEGAYRKVSVTFMITQNQQLNIANVPVSTRYTISESNESGYEFVRIDSSVSNATTEGAMISGTIVPDSDTNITYTNRSLVTDINIQKLDESGDGLEGAVFQLKAVSEDGYVESLASDIESVSGLGTVVKTLDGETKRYASSFESTGELQKISGLPDGTYRLHEVYVPAGYISTYDYIQFEIADRVVKNVTTDSGDDSKLHFEAASGTGTIALLQITNEPGASLPSAGGPGTTIFYIFGSMLAAGCAIVLIARRRIRKN